MDEHYQNLQKQSEDLRKRDSRQGIERANELADLKAVLSMPEGMRFFERLFSQNNLFGETFVSNSNIYKLAALRDFVQLLFKECMAACEGEPGLREQLFDIASDQKK